MKKFKTDNPGGHPLVLEDFGDMQNELFSAAFGLLAGRGLSFKVSGCAITHTGGGIYSVAPGKMFIDDEILNFDGVSGLNWNTTRYKFIKSATPINTKPELYEDGLSRTTRTEYKAVCVIHVEDEVPGEGGSES